jgi:hypothetical protein
MTSPKSVFTINPTTHKISIRKANKIQRRRSRIPNLKLKSMFEIPEDSLNGSLMRRVWGSLKVHTNAHDELNVRPCRCEVQEGANHAPVFSLVDSLTIFIWTKRRSRAHWSRHGLELSYVEVLH